MYKKKNMNPSLLSTSQIVSKQTGIILVVHVNLANENAIWQLTHASQTYIKIHIKLFRLIIYQISLKKNNILTVLSEKKKKQNRVLEKKKVHILTTK